MDTQGCGPQSEIDLILPLQWKLGPLFMFLNVLQVSVFMEEPILSALRKKMNKYTGCLFFTTCTLYKLIDTHTF